jgi:hypothetical protein
MEIYAGHHEAHELLTHRVFLKLTGENGFIDLGNVKDFKNASDRQTKTHMSASKGVRTVDDEQIDTVHNKFEFTLDEFTPDNERFIHLASKGANVTQGAVVAPAGTAQFTNVVLDRVYFVGPLDLNTVVVKVGVATKVLDTDYTLDPKSGAIKILASGTIAAGATVDVTFGNAQVLTNTFSANEQVRFTGDYRIEEYNQDSGIPLRTITGNGTLIVTTPPEHSGDMAKFTCRLTSRSKPKVVKRHAAV